jgi:hypothetical protein
VVLISIPLMKDGDLLNSVSKKSIGGYDGSAKS